MPHHPLQKPRREAHPLLPDSEGACSPAITLPSGRLRWAAGSVRGLTCCPRARASALSGAGAAGVVGEGEGQGLMVPSTCSPCRCGWSWPGSWASGWPSGSWARAWTTSMICSRPSPRAASTSRQRGTHGRAKYRLLCLPGRVCRSPWMGTAEPWDAHLFGSDMRRKPWVGTPRKHSPHPTWPGVQCGFGGFGMVQALRCLDSWQRWLRHVLPPPTRTTLPAHELSRSRSKGWGPLQRPT